MLKKKSCEGIKSYTNALIQYNFGNISGENKKQCIRRLSTSNTKKAKKIKSKEKKSSSINENIKFKANKEGGINFTNVHINININSTELIKLNKKSPKMAGKLIQVLFR